MALSSTTAAYTLIGMAEKFQDFFYADAQDVTFKYMDVNGIILTKTVPNIAKVTNALNINGVTSKVLATTLNNYYTKSGSDGLITALRTELKAYTDTNAVRSLNYIYKTFLDSGYAILENDHVRLNTVDGIVIMTTPAPVANAYFEFNTGDSASKKKIRLEATAGVKLTYGDVTDTFFEINTNSVTLGVRYDSVKKTWRIN